jgi:predicted NUDIX family NTP pyrophosphohydrolase
MDGDGEARAQNEVDDVRWVPLAEARELLTHPRDRALLDRL